MTEPNVCREPGHPHKVWSVAHHVWRCVTCDWSHEQRDARSKQITAAHNAWQAR